MNQYEDQSGHPVLKPALVCYADILGWSSETKAAASEGRSAEHLCVVRTVLREAFANVRSWAKSVFDEPSPPLFDVKVFTDNIVTAFQTASLHEDRGEPALSLMLTVFSRLQMDLARHGLLLRGGVGFGLHYMDEDFAYGPALLDAVAQDAKGAPPRLVLGDSVLPLLLAQIECYSGGPRTTPYARELLLDQDDRLFLNYLDEAFIAWPDGRVFYELVEGHRSTIRSGLTRFAGDSSRRSKYEWLAGYHNFFCTDLHPVPQCGEYTDPQYAAACANLEELASYALEPAPCMIRCLDSRFIQLVSGRLSGPKVI